jgi:fermentation-respiration switch protein FrsA (DUF1100 family)
MMHLNVPRSFRILNIKVIRTIVLAGLILLTLLAFVYVFQRRLIYLPYGQVPKASAVLPGAEDALFETDDSIELKGWFLPAGSSHAGPGVLVANGNAGNRSHRAPLARALARGGISVLLFDYRGYGGNPGTPSEDDLRRDVHAAREYLTHRAQVDPARIFYFGESLGAAVVLDLAAEHPPAGVVLRSPFTSLAEVGRLHYPWLPVRQLLRDRFDSIGTISRLKSPVIVIAGERDTIVPLDQSKALYERAANPKRLVVVEGADHNDAELLDGDQLIEAVLRFIADPTRATSVS